MNYILITIISFAICLFISPIMMILLARFAEGRRLKLAGRGTSEVFFPGEIYVGTFISLSMNNVTYHEQVKITPTFVIIALVIGIGFLFIRIFAPANFPLADWANYSDKRMLYSPTKIYHDVVCMTGMLIWAIIAGLPAFIMMPWNFVGIWHRIYMLAALFMCFLCAIADGKNNPDPYVLYSPTWREDGRKARRR